MSHRCALVTSQDIRSFCTPTLSWHSIHLVAHDDAQWRSALLFNDSPAPGSSIRIIVLYMKTAVFNSELDHHYGLVNW
jgi:hypothetical protein